MATLSLIPNPRCIEWPSLPSVGKSYVFQYKDTEVIYLFLSFFQYLWHHPKWTPLRSMSRVHNGLYYKKYLLLSQENYQLKMAHRFLYDLTHSLVYQTHLSKANYILHLSTAVILLLLRIDSAHKRVCLSCTAENKWCLLRKLHENSLRRDLIRWFIVYIRQQSLRDVDGNCLSIKVIRDMHATSEITLCFPNRTTNPF